MLKRILMALCGMAMAAVAQADGFGLGAHAGLMGPGVDAFYRINDKVVLHGAYNRLDYDYDTSRQSINYKATYAFENGQLGLDWYPFARGFRISTAYVANSNALNLHAIANNNTYVINGNLYTTADVGDLRVGLEYPRSAAYVGIGWGNPVQEGKKLGVTFDIGAVYTGKADVTVDAPCNAAIAGTPRCTQLQNDTEAERQKLKNDLANLTFWPLVQLGLSYNF